MKKYFYLAMAIALASCSNNELLDVLNPTPEKTESTAISFGGVKDGITRADDHKGGDAAGLLDNNFVVEGVMGNGTFADYADANVAFDHYNVNWNDKAFTTESNTKGWEYVGETVHPNTSATTQVMKYWNYGYSQYDFVAFSYGKAGKTNADPTPVLSEINYNNIGKPVYDADGKIIAGNAVYTVTGKTEDLAECYIADLVTMYNRNGVNDYQEIVTPTFRSLGTKVRIAFYETVPGYAVANLKFYNEAWDGSTVTSTNGSETPALFATNKIFPAATSEGVMSVFYPTVGWENSSNGTLSPDYNQAHVTFAQTEGKELDTKMNFDAIVYSTDKEGAETCAQLLGRTSSTASYAGARTADNNNAYEIVLPLGISDNLQIRVEYDLYPIDGGSGVIHVKDARAVVPKEYADWKPNYAYTYIFKISDKTNGWTGTQSVPNPDFDSTKDPDPITNPEFIEKVVEGLTPITFDAVVVDTETGNQETITTVSTPSITTYQEGVAVTSGSEYKTGLIYASVEGNPALSATNAHLYIVTGGKDKVSEATAALAIAQGKTDNATDVFDKTDVKLTQVYPAATDYVTSVPAVDGNTLAINALKWNASASTTYVFEYVNGDKKAYKVVKVQ